MASVNYFLNELIGNKNFKKYAQTCLI